MWCSEKRGIDLWCFSHLLTKTNIFLSNHLKCIILHLFPVTFVGFNKIFLIINTLKPSFGSFSHDTFDTSLFSLMYLSHTLSINHSFTSQSYSCSHNKSKSPSPPILIFFHMTTQLVSYLNFTLNRTVHRWSSSFLQRKWETDIHKKTNRCP